MFSVVKPDVGTRGKSIFSPDLWRKRPSVMLPISQAKITALFNSPFSCVSFLPFFLPQLSLFLVVNTGTSGIPRGYRLVSTYDLTHFLKWGRVFRSKLWSSQIWSFPKWEGGGYSRVNFGHLKSEVFWNGGGGLSGLKFQKGAFWKIWTKIYCSARNLLVHHR